MTAEASGWTRADGLQAAAFVALGQAYPAWLEAQDVRMDAANARRRTFALRRLCLAGFAERFLAGRAYVYRLTLEGVRLYEWNEALPTAALLRRAA